MLRQTTRLTSDKDTNPKYSFSGHESFSLRYAWLPKVVQTVETTPSLFRMDDASTELGVGKNMVSSMRHWALAVDAIRPTDVRGDFEPTDFGRSLFGNEGWDPYFENIATTWLVHWKLASAKERASTWWLAFNRYPDIRFTKESLGNWLYEIAEHSPSTRATRTSIKRDVDVFVRTYVADDHASARIPDETFDSPLSELGMLRSDPTSLAGESIYVIERRQHPTLPIEILAYAIRSYWQDQLAGQSTASFESLCFGEGSPGVIFRLSESQLARQLEDDLEVFGMRFDDTAGMRVVHLAAPDDPSPFQLLDSYFRSRQSEQLT